MSLVTEKTLTLGELSEIALGSNELDNEHLSALQQLLNALLKNLNCQNEIVRIYGYPAKCIQKLLSDKTNATRYRFQCETMNSFQENYELLEELERKAQEFHFKMQQHFEQIRNCHKTKMFAAQKWDFYASPTEDLCTLYMRHNKEFCLLAHNSIFSKELRSRVVPPITERFKVFEAKIENMHSKLREITQVADKTAAKLNCTKNIIKDIENIRTSLNSSATGFRDTMLETQDMLNCKMQRVALPALKKYLEQRFVDIKEHLRVLEVGMNKSAPFTPLKLTNKKTCLSCSRHQECNLHKQFQTLKSIDDSKRCVCSNLLKEPTIVEKIDRMQLLGQVSNAVLPSTHRNSGQKNYSLGILTN